MDHRIILLAGLATTLWASSASAQEFTQGVRSAGMGEAFTSVASGTNAIYHNPAGAARAVMYSVDASYEYTPTGNVLSAAVIDSKTNPNVAAGIGYSFYFGRGDDDIRGHDIRLGLAIPVLPDRISVGVGGRWLIVKDTVLQENEMGEEVNTDVQLMNGPTLDAGIMFKATDQIHLGVAGQNLIPQCSKPECAGAAPQKVTGGVGFSSEAGLTVAGDAGVDLSTRAELGGENTDPALDAGVGAEYLIGGVVPLRAGYQYRGGFQQHLLTFGAGWRSQVAGIDLGYQLDLEDTSNMYFLGSFSIYM
jgi:hypothetical protein